MKRLLIFTLFTLLVCQDAMADNLIIKGDTLRTIFFSVFDNYPGIDKLRDKLSDYATQCTEDNCSFLPTWKIVGGRLMLTSIKNCECNDKKQTANLKSLFGDRLEKGMLPAYWYSGEIWATKDRPNSWGGLFAASWPRETRVIVKNGVVTSVKEFIYPSPVIKPYFKNSDSLNNFIYTHIDWSKLHHLPPQDRRYYFRFDQDTAGYLIHVSQDTLLRPYQILDAAEMVEINRVLGLLQWPLYYYHARPVTTFNRVDMILSEPIRKRYVKPE